MTVYSRLLSFAASVGVATAVGIISVPVLIAAVGSATWGSVAVLQAIGSALGVIVAFGWGVIGPSLIAATTPEARPAVLVESMVIRSCLYILCAVGASVIAALLLSGDVGLAVLGSVTYLLPYLTSPWYFVGEARPDRLFFCNTLPSVGGTVAGTAAIAVTHNLLWFLVCQALGYLTAIILELAVVARSPHEGTIHVPALSGAITTLASQRYAVTSSMVSTLYVSLPLLMVQLVAAPLVPVYAMADRLFRFASIALLPFQQFFQGWIPEGGEAKVRARIGRAVRAGVALGLIGGTAISLLSPFAGSLLSGNAIQIPFALSIPLGIAFVAVACSAMMGYACLTLLGGIRFVARGSVLAAVIGVPLIVAASLSGSLPLVATAVALSEICVAVYQALILRRLMSDGRWSHAGPRA